MEVLKIYCSFIKEGSEIKTKVQKISSVKLEGKLLTGTILGYILEISRKSNITGNVTNYDSVLKRKHIKSYKREELSYI